MPRNDAPLRMRDENVGGPAPTAGGTRYYWEDEDDDFIGPSSPMGMSTDEGAVVHHPQGRRHQE